MSGTIGRAIAALRIASVVGAALLCAGAAAVDPSRPCGDERADAPPTCEALHAAPAKLDDRSAYFARVGSFLTEDSAMEHKRDLERARLGVKAAVFPPRRKGGYWTVVTASYAPKEDAARHVRFARKHLQHDAFLWRAPAAKDGGPETAYRVHPPSVALASYPNLLAPPAPKGDAAPRHFVVVDRAAGKSEAQAAADALRARFPGLRLAVYPLDALGWSVVLAANANEVQREEAKALARRLGIVEDAPVATFSADLARAAMPDDDKLIERAKKLRDDVYGCFKRGAWTVVAMHDCVDAWVTSEAFHACVGDAPATGVIPGFVDPQACVAIKDGINAEHVVRKLRADLERRIDVLPEKFKAAIPPPGKLAACKTAAGGDQKALQECALAAIATEDQRKALACLEKSGRELAACIAGAVPADAPPEVRDALAKAGACAEAKTADEAVKCVRLALAPSDAARLEKAEKCLRSAKSEREVASECLGLLVEDEKQRAWVECLRRSGADKDAAGKCLLDATLKDKPEIAAAAERARCVAAAKPDPAKTAACLRGVVDTGLGARGVGCLADGKTQVADFATCMAGDDAGKAIKTVECARNAGSASAALRECGAPMLGGDAGRFAECAMNAVDDAAAAAAGCAKAAGLSEDALRAIEVGRCLRERKDDKFALAGCLAKGQTDANVAAAVEVAGCVAKAQGESKAKADLKDDEKAVKAFGTIANCAAPHIGGTGGKIAACMASQDPTARDPLMCMGAVDPKLAAAQQAYACVNGAKGDVGDMIESCGGGVLDQKTRQTAACLARSGTDTGRLAGCAAQGLLDGEAGRLAGCAATSQGATSFAVCAAAPHVNEEWRIAAECAASSGGEPISFGVCTGGRLTVRELTGCLSHPIGSDGCFGKGNTIRKFVENAISDITNGPGENNEIVKAGRAIGEGLKGAGEVLETAVQPIVKVGEALAKGVGAVFDAAGNVIKAGGDAVRDLGRAIGDVFGW